MCGFSMADIRNVQIKASPTYSTYFSVTDYAITPRTDVAGSHIVLHLFLHFVGAIGDDAGVASAERWFKGTVGGQGFAFMWKASGTYMASGDYGWDVIYDAAYIAGTVEATLYCSNGVGTTGTSSTPVWGAGYTANAAYAAAPNAPHSLAFNGAPDVQVVANYAAGTFSWVDGGGGTGGTRSYNIYCATAGSGGWVYLANTGAASIALNPANYNGTRGTYVSFMVCAVGLYGVAWPPSVYPSVYLANIASAPAWVNTAPNPGKYKDTLTVSWAAAAANSGSIDLCHIYVRHLPKGGAWTDWVHVIEVGNVTSATTIPSQYGAPFTARPGSTFQYRVYSRNTYGLWSSPTDGPTVLLKGGIMKAKVAGTWREGVGWVKVSGAWREALSVYTKVAGVWRESI